MPSRSDIFRDPVPTEPRLAVDLPCVLHDNTDRVAAKVRNINHFGLQIALLEDAARAVREPRSVEIAGVGTFDVAVVWCRYGRIGLKFTDRQAATALLNAYCASTGICP